MTESKSDHKETLIEKVDKPNTHFPEVKWGALSSLVIGFLAFILPQVMAVFALLIGGAIFGADTDNLLTDESNIFLNFMFGFIVSILSLLIIWLFIRNRGGISALRLKKPKLKAMLKVIPVFGVYVLALFVALTLVSVFVPEVDLDQDQVVGFESAKSTFEYIFAFLSLVVLAPFVEEIMFRGFILQGLMKKMHWILAALISSALFGLAHGQINVAIDTAVLGLAASWLTIRTLSLWPAILLHGIKNSIAFIFLFVIS